MRIMEMSLSAGNRFRAALLGLAFALVGGLAHGEDATGADPKASAKEFASALVADLGAAANDPALTDMAREAALRDVLRERLEVEAIGRFLFRGAPDDLASSDQRDAYMTIFPDYIAAAFAEEIGELAGRRIEVGRAILRGDDEAIVQSKLVDTAGIEKAKIDWRLRWRDGDPLLLDVMVERVSPLVTKRQEFSSIAERRGVDALLAHMNETVGVRETKNSPAP
jgi:phospholipid transport system substrate-binding protein